MLFVLRIYFEDVQTCLTIKRAVQIIIVTPESGEKAVVRKKKKEKVTSFGQPAKSDGSWQSLSSPAKFHSSVTGMYTMACEQSTQCTTPSSEKHPMTWSC